MVEECGATFAEMDVSKCTHLVTTDTGIKQGYIKGNPKINNNLEGS
jgi:hypothetical protein